MKLAARLRSWLRASSHRAKFEEEMDQELQFHLDQQRQDLVRQGIPAAEAERLARVGFGAIAARKDECRESVGLRLVDDLRADLRYAFRMLRQSKAFTTVAVLSVALGIGANTAIFSLMEAALWKPLPLRNPQELRVLNWVSGPKAVMNSTNGNAVFRPTYTSSSSFSYAAYLDLRRRNTTLQSIFAFKRANRLTAVIDGHAELLTSQLISGNFYDSLGTYPAQGRPITQQDDSRTAPETAAVISDGFWTRRFGRDPAAIGKKIMVNDTPVTIVGVNPEGFTGVELQRDPDISLPLALQPRVFPFRYAKPGANGSVLDDPDTWWLVMMGRLKPGVPEAAAQAELDSVLTATVRATLPDRADRDQPHMRLAPGARGLDDLNYYRTPLFVLISFVGLVLLIACANVANLLLARASTRQREISVRLALGAGRGRMIRQLLTEGLTLAAIAGAAGVALGYALRNVIPLLLTSSWRPSPFLAEFDGRVVLGALALTLLTGLLFSMAPAWQSRRVSVNMGLKEGGRTTVSRSLAAKSLVVIQVAMALPMVLGAGLFVRTLANLQSTPLGFQPDRILLFNVDPARTRYQMDARKILYTRIAEGLRSIPGVQAASLSSEALVASSSSTTSVPRADGQQLPERLRAWILDVGDDFFATMGIPILYGRPIGVEDQSNSPLAAVVNQAFVAKVWPGQAPLGKTFERGDQHYTVVGIAADVHYDQLRNPPPPTFYPSYRQESDRQLGGATFEIKTSIPTEGIVRAARAAVASIDPDLPVFDFRTQDEQIDATLSREHLYATLTSALGGLALFLTCVGIYGIMSHSVARRTNEIGIRMALGAARGRMIRMILRESGLLVVLGVAAGAAASFGLARYVESLLFGLKPSDAATLAAAIAILAAAGLFAAWWPARRASRVDPMVALRHE